MEICVLSSRTEKVLCTLTDISPASSIYEVKKAVYKSKKKIHPDRQGLKADPKGKLLSDDILLKTLDLKDGKNLYLKDLGPQIGYKTVFLLEYFGPLLIYLYTYSRPALLFGSDAAIRPYAFVVHIAAICWGFHYIKRILETLFIHRFSHATMPLFNLFKNCSYYWLFALYIGYHVNHPLYTTPYFDDLQAMVMVMFFVYCELGNMSIHLLLKNLRPEGSKKRVIPYPTENPFSLLYNSVSCPNYTYEVGAWLFFSIMTQCLPAFLFTVAGFVQMSIWAQQKHKAYLKMPDYPRNRKAIVPFLL